MNNNSEITFDLFITNFLNILPDILWVAVVLYIILKFKTPINLLLSRLGTVKFGDVELQFVSYAFESIFRQAEERKQWPAIKVSKQDQLLVTNRINRMKNRITGRKILWVDDHPSNNEIEFSMFKQLNVSIDRAMSTEEAVKKIKRDSYDIVVSDMNRDDNAKAGLDMLEEFKQKNINIPVIFYVGNIDKTGTPAGSFGITNKPHELFHLFIDAIERSL